MSLESPPTTTDEYPETPSSVPMDDEKPSSSSEGGKVVPDNLEEWRGAVGKTRTAIEETTSLLSDIEAAITKAADQGLDKGVITEAYSGLIKTMKEIAKLKEMLGDHVRPFSKMKWDDLPSIGVKKKPRVVRVGILRLKLVASRETDPLYTGPAKTIVGEMQIALEWWIDALNLHSEASARIFVDICLLGVLKLAPHVLFDGSSSGKIIVCPELLLSNSMNEPEVIAEQDLTELTVLSGNTDYAVAYIPGWSGLSSDKRNLARDALKELLGLKPEGRSLKKVNKLARLLLSLVETKRAGTQGKGLLEALPQVIAQAVVAGRRSQPKDTSPLPIPFILTNGFEWIFAALKHEPSDDGGDDWTCIRSEPQIIPKDGLMEGAGPEKKAETEAGLRAVLDMLVHWICLERDVILGQLDGCEPVTPEVENVET
ncbi:hypothetical protein FS837_006046 [Tulasnella sp. UAMH 9824]|nr:hypothetical protein FS837_006046 [Tulasnella sp. UAMH 9824]